MCFLPYKFMRSCLLVCLVSCLGVVPRLYADDDSKDLSASYVWKPVCIGAGGFVTGFTTSQTDAKVRFARTDVGNAYRWDASANRWIPMIVRNDDGTGFPADVVPSPAVSGVESIAVDPADSNKVYVATRFGYSADIGLGGLGINVYKSVDGGRNFTARGNLNLSDDPNGNWRWTGERLKVDPVNGNVLYFATMSAGFYRSVDGGLTWSQVVADGGPDPLSHVNSVQFDPSEAQAALGLTKVSRVVYAIQLRADSRYTNSGGTWSAGTFAGREEVYLQTSDRSSSPTLTSCSTAGPAELDDCVVSAQVAIPESVKGSRAGVIARYRPSPAYKSKHDYYGLFIEDNGSNHRWLVCKSVNDGLTELAQGPLNYSANTYRYLRLEIKGKTLKAFESTDGRSFRLLTSTDDSAAPLLRGQFGLSTYGTSAGFADVTARRGAGLRYTSDFKRGDTRVWQDADVYQSKDGGVSWANISNMPGLSHHCSGITTIDSNGALWAAQDGSQTLWKFTVDSWKSFSPGMGVNGIPMSPVRLMAVPAGLTWDRRESARHLVGYRSESMSGAATAGFTLTMPAACGCPKATKVCSPGPPERITPKPQAILPPGRSVRRVSRNWSRRTWSSLRARAIML